MSRLNVARNAARSAAHRVHLRLGANGLLGAGLLALALVGLLYARQAQQEAARLQVELDQARSRAAQVHTAPAVNVEPAERLSRFQQWFPTVDTSARDLRRIFHAAQQSHVVLAKGEYSLSPIDGSGGLQKYDVVLPVKENYAAVKGFVAEVLNELPHASLAELRAERPASAADEIDTRVHFTLYYRTPPA